MRTAYPRVALPLLAGALFALPAAAQQPPEPRFAAPVRLMAGGKLLGWNRLYPSPVLHDMNGDGRLDVVVGDLFGRMTVAPRQPGDDPRAFGAETPLAGADGKTLDFHNW